MKDIRKILNRHDNVVVRDTARSTVLGLARNALLVLPSTTGKINHEKSITRSFHNSRLLGHDRLLAHNDSDLKTIEFSDKMNIIGVHQQDFISSNFYSDIIKIPSQVTIKKIENSLFFEGPLGSVEMGISKIDVKGQGFFRICTAKDLLSRTLTSNINDKSTYLEVFVKKTSKTSKAFFGTLLSLYRNNLYGVSQGFLIYLELIGVGFRAIIHENSQENILQDPLIKKSITSDSKAVIAQGGLNKKVTNNCLDKVNDIPLISVVNKIVQKVEFKIGQSHEIIYRIPENLRIFSLKPTLICLYGLDKIQVTQVASEIRNLKVPEPYKGKGIRYKDEIVKIKVGKKK